jgi:phosphoribosylanthranilate isomerase
MNKIRIKICGITRKQDALLASELGAWAAGFIFVKNTPRYIMPEAATEIIQELTEGLENELSHSEKQSSSSGLHSRFAIEKIGVFADASLEEIKNIAEKTGITKIQLHGQETPEYCKNLGNLTGKEIIKAIRIKSKDDLNILRDYKGKASFILLDSYSENKLGGTGKVFDWEIAKIATEQEIPIILAGGLNSDNIKQAYEIVKPYAFDISSGVEADCEQRINDPEKLEKLFSVIKIS